MNPLPATREADESGGSILKGLFTDFMDFISLGTYSERGRINEYDLNHPDQNRAGDGRIDNYRDPDNIGLPQHGEPKF